MADLSIESPVYTHSAQEAMDLRDAEGDAAEFCEMCRYFPCSCGEQDMILAQRPGHFDADSESEEEEDWERGLQRYTLEQQIQLCRSYASFANNKLKARKKRRKLFRQDAMDGLKDACLSGCFKGVTKINKCL